MNTKLLFYCTNVSSDGITKIVFETILPGDNINSISDATDWIDDNISKHCDNFYLDFVLDWFVLLYEPTNEEPKETEIVKTVSGKLIFEDDTDYHYYELGKVVSEKNKIKDEIKIKDDIKKKKKEAKPKKREYPSVWIEPSGETHEVGFACHNQFATEWLKENDEEEYEKSLHSNSYFYETLEELGWIRILGWTEPPSFVIRGRVTPKQRIALKDYCLSNNISYHAFPEVLKS